MFCRKEGRRLAALAQTMEVITDCVVLFEDILSHSF